jgi:hypothetical protein
MGHLPAYAADVAKRFVEFAHIVTLQCKVDHGGSACQVSIHQFPSGKNVVEIYDLDGN